MDWTWLAEHADSLLAIGAILGPLIAIVLALLSMRVARQATRTAREERLVSYFSDLMDRVVEYQHPALLPYWNAPPQHPVDPTSTTATELHRALVRAETSLAIARMVELRALDNQIRIVEATLKPLYDFAQRNSVAEARQQADRSDGFSQPWEGAWGETEAALRGSLERVLKGSAEVDLGEALAKFRAHARSTYTEESVGRMQLADAVLNHARHELVLAFREQLPKLAAKPADQRGGRSRR